MTNSALSGIAFTDDHHRAIGVFSDTLGPLGFRCVIAGDHENYEELAEVRPIGRMSMVAAIHAIPDGRFEASHVERNLGGAFATLEDALDWIGDTLRERPTH